MNLEEALESCEDRDNYPHIFYENVGLDISVDGFVTNGYWLMSGNPRSIMLSIKSFPECKHFYGTIKVEGVSFSKKDNLKVFVANRNIYESTKNLPLSYPYYYIDISRKVTKEDKNRDPNRWTHIEVGSYTTAFDSKDDLISTAYDIIINRFSGRWEIQILDETSFEDYDSIELNKLIRNYDSRRIS